MKPNNLPLILASTSTYRAELLKKLGIPFLTAAPNVDESPLENESAQQLAFRLAELKAKALKNNYPNHIIIGSDQVATTPSGLILGKPGSHTKAKHQLSECSGKSIIFYTGLSVFNSQTNQVNTIIDKYTVKFRNLSQKTIECYLERERPYDCARSFKMEGLGICLFEALEGKDPNTLIGLPLIDLVTMLEKEGISALQCDE